MEFSRLLLAKIFYPLLLCCFRAKTLLKKRVRVQTALFRKSWPHIEKTCYVQILEKSRTV
jgi:hypothetical protein